MAYNCVFVEWMHSWEKTVSDGAGVFKNRRLTMMYAHHHGEIGRSPYHLNTPYHLSPNHTHPHMYECIQTHTCS